MPRKGDEFRQYVETFKDEKGTWLKCKFCGEKFKGGGTRIKAHLAKAKRYGITECGEVDDEVRERAWEALRGKRVQDGDGAGNENTSPHQHSMNNTVHEDAYRPINHRPASMREDFPSLPFPGPHGSQEVSQINANLYRHLLPTNQFSSIPMGHHHIQDTNEEAANVSHAQPQPQPQISSSDVAAQNMCNDHLRTHQGLGEATTDGSQLLPNVEQINTEFQVPRVLLSSDLDLRINAPMENQPRDSHPSRKNVRTGGKRKWVASECGKRDPLVTTQLVGKDSQDKVVEICDCLMNDKTSIIGVCGMGGVGKTAIAMNVHNRLLESAVFGDDVFWVTVPHEFSVYELQSAIADAANIVDPFKDKDVKRRAARLSSHLKQKDKWVLILDDLWTHFKLEDVGIPKVVGGSKLVLTTRSLDVCLRMLCQKQIVIQPLQLFYEEGWNLFLGTLSVIKELPLEVEKIARQLVSKCGGLSLGIIEIATRMRGEENVMVWRDMLKMLEESKVELEVFKVLELSYRSLDDHELQQIFLHCVLLQTGSKFGGPVKCDGIVESLIDKGWTYRINSSENLYDRCCILLDKLQNAFLLQRMCWGTQSNPMWMHPLIHGMALQMMRTKYMVKSGMNLEDMLDEKSWTSDLEKICLADGCIKAVPSYFSPNCPKLTTLLLIGNESLEMIPDPFFKHLLGLEILNLSECGIKELPMSISNLVNLRALVLRGCSALHHVPYLGKLRCLRTLKLCRCEVLKELPEGLESLVNLSYLNISGTKIDKLSEESLAALENLQYIVIENVILEAQTKLKKLETVEGYFSRWEAFDSCERFIAHNSIRMYKLYFAEGIDHFDYDVLGFAGKDHLVRIDGGKRPINEGVSSDGYLPLPHDVNELQVYHCHEMKHVIGWEWRALLPSLRKISVKGCDEMEEIIAGPYLRMPQQGAFFPLTDLVVYSCPEMRKLFAAELLVRLPNLERLEVRNCAKMEEIIGGRGGEEGSSVNTIRTSHVLSSFSPYRFPNLKKLVLRNLSKLKTISEGMLACDKIESITLIRCPKLEKVPLQGPPPSLRAIEMVKAEWELLQWGHPSVFDKSLLLPLVRLVGSSRFSSI